MDTIAAEREDTCRKCGRAIRLLLGEWTDEDYGLNCDADRSAPYAPHEPTGGQP